MWSFVPGARQLALLKAGSEVKAFTVVGGSLAFCRSNDFVTSLSMAKKKKGGSDSEDYMKDTDFVVDEAMETMLAETEERMKNEADKWRSIKLMKPEEAAANLDEEWLGAYTRYHAQMKEDMESMVEIATLVAKLSETNRILPKTKGQRKRDAWARKQARTAVVTK